MMDTRKKPVVSFLIGLTLFSALSSFALNDSVRQFVTWETRSNAVSTRNSAPIRVQHYEIPLEIVGTQFGKNLPQAVQDSLIFERGGKKYVRWLINTEDTKWHLELEDYLRKQGLSTQKHEYFTAYLTASRSMIVEDPQSGMQFSVKVSTNKTGGHWTDKKQTFEDAHDIRAIDGYIQDVAQKVVFEHAKTLDEPAVFGIPAIDQGMAIRLLGDLSEGGKHYLPGFSTVHDATGREIAKMNGSNNPAEFWNEHYNKPLARALAEFAAHTGLAFDSPHSQNFLVELDKNMRPTGRIILRDVSDVYLLEEFLDGAGKKSIAENFTLRENVIQGELQAAVGILHGNQFPSWLSDAEYNAWGKAFYEEYEKVFSQLTDIPKAELAATRLSRNGAYFSKNYPARSPAWKEYLARAACYNGLAKTLKGAKCPEQVKEKTRMAHSRRCGGLFESNAFAW